MYRANHGPCLQLVSTQAFFLQLLSLVRNVERPRVGHDFLIGATRAIIVVASGRDHVR